MNKTRFQNLNIMRFRDIQPKRQARWRKYYLSHTKMNNDSGVSNIVTSIMMLGIFLSILAMIFTVYIPNWAKSEESGHMGKAMDSFLDLKSTVDNQIGDDRGVGSSYKTQIKLGVEGGAVLGIGRTSGSLAYRTSGFEIQVYNTDDTQNIYGQGSGKITFEPRNVYFSNQYFTYENGALIIEQSNKGVMRAKPNLEISYVNNRTTLDLTIVHLSGTSDNVGGSGYHTIDTKLIQSIAQSHELIWTAAMGFDYGQNITINITTKYGDIWKDFIETQLDDLPPDILANNTQVDLYKDTDPQTRETIYNVVIELYEVYQLDCKIGTVEVDLN